MSEEDNTETIVPISDNKDDIKRNTVEEVDTNIQISNEEPQEKKYYDLDFLEYDSDEEEHSSHSSKSNNENQNSNSRVIEEIESNDDNITNRCAYCGISSPTKLIKCNECKKYFCNGRLDSFTASHIVFHLTKSKHKELYLSPNSCLGEMFLECYNCSQKNIFLLGFLESKEGNSGIFICREPCLTTCKIDDNNFDKTKWISLINDKKILDWIVNPPSNDNENRLCQIVNIRNMSKLEDKWEKEKILSSQEKPKYLGNYLKSVKLCYNDGQDYLETFEPLISAEEEYDRKLKETQKKNNIKVKFEKKGKKIIAKFVYPREDNEIKLVPGDELKLTEPKTNMSYRGFVIEIELDDEIWLEIDLHKNSNLNSKENNNNHNNYNGNKNGGKISIDNLIDGDYIIEFVWKGTSFKRMLDGLYIFVNDESSVSNYIYSKLLGHNVNEKKFNYSIPKDLSVKGLPSLNFFQKLGIKKALTSPLFLIQGPPGTGKTVTSAAIVYHLVQLKQGKVLVCAPSNIAADQLSEKIEKIGVRVIRVCAKSRESISSRVEHLTLHNQLKNYIAKNNTKKDFKKLEIFMKKKEEEGNVLTNKEHEQYKKLKKKFEDDLIDQAEVVVTTCISSFDKRLDSFRFPMVLIDEATQACESECILPLLRGAKHAILVGDHCQLGPVVLCKNAAKAGLKISLFERLVKLKIKPHMLQVQYRMHPKLSEFPSNTFYDGNLQNGVSAEERKHLNVNFPWPNNNKPTFFYHIIGKEEFSASGTSYINRQEADFIELLVKTFMKYTVKPEQIGIITPYEGQRCYILSHLMKNFISNNDIEVASVDSFQGREKDYIILSCVRSNDHNGIGFLDDPRRINVALTRARYGLVIVGNSISLNKHQLWTNLLYHYKEMGLLVEGQLGNFKEVMITLPQPKRYLPEKKIFDNGDINGFNNDFNISYNENNMKSNVLAEDEIFNDATVSRFSEFGYTNDNEAMSHFNKVKNQLKKNQILVKNEFINNQYENYVNEFNNNRFLKNYNDVVQFDLNNNKNENNENNENNNNANNNNNNLNNNMNVNNNNGINNNNPYPNNINNNNMFMNMMMNNNNNNINKVQMMKLMYMQQMMKMNPAMNNLNPFYLNNNNQLRYFGMNNFNNNMNSVNNNMNGGYYKASPAEKKFMETEF